jgi:hypothetical protein
MTSSQAVKALAKASAALVDEHDVAGFLATLLANCQDVLAVDASGILVSQRGRLELLSASRHEAAELELHQAQLEEGPCVEAQATGQFVDASEDDLTRRWPEFGPIMLRAGFHAVHAAPLRWHGITLGAMGMFRRSGTELSADEGTCAQAFADLATLLIMQTDHHDMASLQERVERALATRIVVEQAKGVLAELEGLDMSDAYSLLLTRAEREGRTLTDTAIAVVEEAQSRRV